MGEYVGRTSPGMIKFVKNTATFMFLYSFGADICDMNGNLVDQRFDFSIERMN
jgi:hypothetical protein